MQAGLTPLQALQSAIMPGPAFLRKEADFGSIAAGKQADIVLLDKNPLLDIAATQAINTVVLHGVVYNRKALDAMLAEIKAKVGR